MPSPITYYPDCSVVIVGCKLYTNSIRTIPVSNGFYSDGTTCYTVTGGLGQVTLISQCIPPTTAPPQGIITITNDTDLNTILNVSPVFYTISTSFPVMPLSSFVGTHIGYTGIVVVTVRITNEFPHTIYLYVNGILIDSQSTNPGVQSYSLGPATILATDNVLIVLA